MTARELPSRPNLDQYRKQAKDLLKSYKLGEADVLTRVTQHHPEFRKVTSRAFHLSDAQWVIAREHGFESWAKFADHIGRTAAQNSEPTRSLANSIFTIDLDIKSDEVNTCVFTRDGKLAVMCVQGAPVRVWDVETGRCVRTFDSDSVSAWAAIWSPNERHVFLGTRDGIVQMWDVETSRRLHVFAGHYGLMRCLDVSSDGSRLLSAAAFRDTTVRLWDVNSERCLKGMVGHSDASMTWLSMPRSDEHSPARETERFESGIWKPGNAGKCSNDIRITFIPFSGATTSAEFCPAPKTSVFGMWRPDAASASSTRSIRRSFADLPGALTNARRCRRRMMARCACGMSITDDVYACSKVIA